MPNWKKVIVSGSDAVLNSVTASAGFFGTASWASSASHALTSYTFATSIGNGSATNIGVTHNMGTRDVIVQLYDTTTYETIVCDIVRTDINFVTCSFAVAPGTNQYRVVIKS